MIPGCLLPQDSWLSNTTELLGVSRTSCPSHRLPTKQTPHNLHLGSRWSFLLEGDSTPHESYFLLREANSYSAHVLVQTSSSESLLGVTGPLSKNPRLGSLHAHSILKLRPCWMESVHLSDLAASPTTNTSPSTPAPCLFVSMVATPSPEPAAQPTSKRLSSSC